MIGRSVVKSEFVLGFAQAMRMLGSGLEPHQIDDVDDPNLQIGQMFAQD